MLADTSEILKRSDTLSKRFVKERSKYWGKVRQQNNRKKLLSMNAEDPLKVSSPQDPPKQQMQPELSKPLPAAAGDATPPPPAEPRYNCHWDFGNKCAVLRFGGEVHTSTAVSMLSPKMGDRSDVVADFSQVGINTVKVAAVWWKLVQDSIRGDSGKSSDTKKAPMFRRYVSSSVDPMHVEIVVMHVFWVVCGVSRFRAI
jgi:hypothetical protein